MFEVLTKKRLLMGLGIVIFVSFSSFLVQSHWTYKGQLDKLENKIKGKAKLTASCQVFKTVSPCEICPREELRNEKKVCMETGYKEMIECEDGKREYIWCDISPAVEESEFWKFEGITLFIGLSSYAVVYLRQRKLDKILMEKIHKQISSGL